MNEGKTIDEVLKAGLEKAALEFAREKMKKTEELTAYERVMRDFRNLPDLPEHNEPI